jgi:mRNA interferase MazF
MRRGEVWWANLPEPWGRRPALLLARDEAYDVLTWVMVAPITTNVRPIPTAVALEPAIDGVPRPCAAALDNIQAIRTRWIDTRITSLSAERMREVEQAIHFALDLSF